MYHVIYCVFQICTWLFQHASEEMQRETADVHEGNERGEISSDRGGAYLPTDLPTRELARDALTSTFHSWANKRTSIN